MADEIARGAARWATAVAVPTALAIGLGGYLLLSPAPAAESRQPGTPPGVSATTPVTMPVVPTGAATRRACADVVARTPPAIRHLARRPVVGADATSTAYGEPAITMACGGTAPTYPGTDLVFNLDSVCWHSTVTPTGIDFTTVDRTIPVRVHIPTVYGSAGQWAIEFSGPVAAALPPTANVPFGCRG
ncbi:DUF3515 family protein [Pilimelia columellifera]|uniref:DUF3515 domain-containing protein n=1 Tax=Pilimelia columellifera subsp. columellifera TaxID=706583 RepID=A0ABP6AIA3_9ACTN